MAKERVSRTICDRCKAVYEEADTNEHAGSTTAGPPKVYVEVKGEKVLSLEDLCDKCDKRVGALVKDMKLDKPEKTKGKVKKPAAKKDSKKEKPAPEGDKPAS